VPHLCAHPLARSQSIIALAKLQTFCIGK